MEAKPQTSSTDINSKTHSCGMLWVQAVNFLSGVCQGSLEFRNPEDLGFPAYQLQLLGQVIFFLAWASVVSSVKWE